MTNAKPYNVNVFTRLADWQVVEIKGPEAQDFLQRLTSVNFKQLKAGSFSPGTLLTANGKIALYFKVLVPEAGRYLLLLPPPARTTAAAQTAYEAFEKMHFRENLTITAQPGQWAYLRLLASDARRIEKLNAAIPNPGEIKVTKDERIILNENRWCVAPVKLDLGILVPMARLEGVTQILKQSEFDLLPNLELYRLRAGDPGVPAELNETTIPLEARLDDAVHENKGCYPGQEVVERIRAMGQAPRALARIRGQGTAPALPAAIKVGEQDAGELTSVCADPMDGGWVGLGYIKKMFAKGEDQFAVETLPVSVQLT